YLAHRALASVPTRRSSDLRDLDKGSNVELSIAEPMLHGLCDAGGGVVVQKLDPVAGQRRFHRDPRGRNAEGMRDDQAVQRARHREGAVADILDYVLYWTHHVDQKNVAAAGKPATGFIHIHVVRNDSYLVGGIRAVPQEISWQKYRRISENVGAVITQFETSCARQRTA